MTDARLAIVTLNWNGAADTIACLESVERAGLPARQVVVVDNGSRAGDVERVAAAAAARPWVTLVRNDENLGFAGGCNVGIEVALERGADFVLVLNNDATLEPGACELLVRYLEEHPRVGLVSPLITDETGERIWAAGGAIARREVVCTLGLGGRAVARAPASPFEAYALIGCAILARRELFEQIGGFDADYFAYVEDVDFSRRALEAGWGAVVVPQARVRHRAASSTGGRYSPLRSYLLGRGTGLFVRRRGLVSQRIGFALAAPVGLVAAAAREVPRRNVGAVAAKLRGYVDGLLGRPVDRRYFPE